MFRARNCNQTFSLLLSYFFCEKSNLRWRLAGNLAPCSCAGARSAGCEKTRPSVFVSLRRDESLRWGSDISSQRSPLFIRRYYRNLSDYTDSAHAVCLSYFDCCCKASNQTVRDAARLNSRRREGVAGDFPPPQVPAVVQV